MKFLIVGLGSMGKRRVRNLLHLNAGEIVGFDPRLDRCEEVAARFGIQTFSDIDRAVATNPDALVISTPPNLHMRYALMAAKIDRHFFVEASVVDDGMDEVIALCQDKSIVAAPSCTMRFHPSVQTIKELISSGQVGPVLAFTYHSGQYLPDWHPWEDYRSFYVANRETGGCREIVPFELAWLTWVMGEVDAISCFKGKLSRLDVDIDDAYQLLLGFRQGALGHMMVDVISRVSCRACRFITEENVVEWTWSDKCVRLYSASSATWKDYPEPESPSAYGDSIAEYMYVDEMRAFVQAVRGEAIYPYSLTEDKRILDLLANAEVSARENLHVVVRAPERRIVESNRPMSGQALYLRAKRRIPGGTQLLSKRPEMFLPEQWPSYYSTAKGAEVWDLDGNKYVDMSYCGIGATVLGFADPDVDQAVRGAISAGSMATLLCPEEVELADLLCELHPWAEMVRYSRSGGEAMAISVRIARAATGRQKVAFCGYHGWHDWYLAANLGAEDALDGHLLPGLDPAGVPRALAGAAFPFSYNDLEELEAIVSAHGDDLAAIVMEPVRNYEPKPGFLERIREIATEIGAVLIFDEVTSGWRLNTGGVHLLYGVFPDIAVFAKAIANGYPMAAIIGVRSVMEAAQTSFISSTNWTERIGPVAALSTIRKHLRCNVPKHLVEVGESVKLGWRTAAEAARLSIEVTGLAPLAHFSFQDSNAQAMRTLYTQMMLDRGFLASHAFYAMYAHEEHHVNSFLSALTEAFAAIALAAQRDEIGSRLRGPVAHTGFRRLT